MLACKIHAKEDLRIEAADTPTPGPGEVLLRLGAAGICGSDLHYYFEGRNGSFIVREPLIPGHEASGVVAAVGPGVTRVKKGDNVAISPSHACGRCDYCREGREHLCTKMKFLGSASLFPHVQGMFQEYFVMGERQCYPVAGDITLGELAFAEPLAVGLHAVNRGGDLLGKSVLITGAGTIGCVTVLAARLAGAKKITVTDVLDRPLAQAKLVGADVTLRADREGEALATPQFDVAYEVSGNFNALKSCVAATKLGQLCGAQVLHGRSQARRRGRAGGHTAARAAAVCSQRDHGQGTRLARRVPVGDRIRLGGGIPVVAPRRRPSAAFRPISAAGRGRRISRRSGQEQEHQGSGYLLVVGTQQVRGTSAHSQQAPRRRHAFDFETCSHGLCGMRDCCGGSRARAAEVEVGARL
jgi:L-idonate 5-dehydrogenase